MAGWRLGLLGAAGFAAVFAVAVGLTAGPDVLRQLASAPQCHAAARVADAVEPLTTGPMAAMQTLNPTDVASLPYDGRGGAAARLGELRGRVILLNLWATWCAPCRAEMPALAALHEALGGDDFAVIAVSIDDKDRNRPQDFLAETGADALAYHREPTLALFNSLRAADLAMGMPTTLLIAEDGCAAAVLHGAAVWDGAAAKRLIRAAIDA